MTSIEGIQLDEIEESGFGKEVTQDAWESLVEWGVQYGGTVDLAEVLSSHGFSNIIRGVRVSSNYRLSIDVSNCHFVDCDMREANFSLSTFKNVTFSRCALEGSIFYKVQADGLKLKDCYLPFSCWNQAELNDFNIESSPFQRIWEPRSVIVGMTLVMAKVTGQSSIQNCSLHNIIFAETQTQFSLIDCTPHVIDHPVIGIGLDPMSPAFYASLEVQSIRRFGGIPVYYQHYPEEIDSKSFAKSVCKALGEYPESCGMSRAQWLLENQTNEHVIEKVKRIAEGYFSVFDGIIIPGGHDVPEILYKNVNDGSDATPKDFVRSIMEIVLLQFCAQKKKPLIGICRGSQIANVFLGGTLKDITEKEGPLQLKDINEKERINLANSSSFIPFMDKVKEEEEIYALSLHHQAIDQLGATVVPLIILDDIVKFSLAQEGLFTLSQVHPEAIVWGEEGNIFSHQKYLCHTLKDWIAKVNECGQTEEKLERALETVLFYSGMKNEDASFYEFELDNESAGEALSPIRSAYFSHRARSNDFGSFLKENRDLLVECLEKEIKECELFGKKFLLMMSFARHVFELFFENVSLSLLDMKELTA